MQCTAVYKKQGKWFIGWVEEIPGVNTQGKTMEEVKANLKEALALIEDKTLLNKVNERELVVGKLVSHKSVWK